MFIMSVDIQPPPSFPPAVDASPGPVALEKPPGPFLRVANWVSEAMGRPTNIIFWFVLVFAWTAVFAFGGPHLATGSWLPKWFTSAGSDC